MEVLSEARHFWIECDIPIGGYEFHFTEDDTLSCMCVGNSYYVNIKTIQMGVHSTASAIYQCYLRQTIRKVDNEKFLPLDMAIADLIRIAGVARGKLLEDRTLDDILF